MTDYFDSYLKRCIISQMVIENRTTSEVVEDGSIKKPLSSPNQKLGHVLSGPFAPLENLGRETSVETIKAAIQTLPTIGPLTPFSKKAVSYLTLFLAEASLEQKNPPVFSLNEEFLSQMGTLCLDLPDDQIFEMKASTFQKIRYTILKRFSDHLTVGRIPCPEEPTIYLFDWVRRNVPDLASFQRNMLRTAQNPLTEPFIDVRRRFRRTLYCAHEAVYGERFGFHPDRIAEDHDVTIEEDREKSRPNKPKRSLNQSGKTPYTIQKLSAKRLSRIQGKQTRKSSS